LGTVGPNSVAVAGGGTDADATTGERFAKRCGGRDAQRAKPTTSAPATQSAVTQTRARGGLLVVCVTFRLFFTTRSIERR
jgi:hypothetical protein